MLGRVACRISRARNVSQTNNKIRIARSSLVANTRRNMSSPSKQHIPESAMKQRPEDTIFAKIVKKEIPAKIVYEDDKCLAFHDINPVAPTHILIIPKRPLGGIADADWSYAEDLGHCMIAAKEVAHKVGLTEGYRLVVNEGPHGLQSVRWVHIHLIGGKKLSWPPGC